MKVKKIRFFAPQDNQKSPALQPGLLGIISATGKLVFSVKTAKQLGFHKVDYRFRVDTKASKRKATALYLIPSVDIIDTFSFKKAGRSYELPLADTLLSTGLNFKKVRYHFTVGSFGHKQGVNGYKLEIRKRQAKRPAMGNRAAVGKRISK